MRLLLIRLLFRLLKIPFNRQTDSPNIKEWLGLQYPLKGFRDYISNRDFQILQRLGEGVSREEYLSYLGQRTELGKLLTEAKTNFEKAEKKRNAVLRETKAED